MIGTDSYPTQMLAGCQSALILFGSGYGGENDGRHIRSAEIADVTVVDLDDASLRAMEAAYPSDWNFVYGDAFEFAEEAREREDRWDLVSADFPADLVIEMLSELSLLCSVAAEIVVSTVMRHNFPGDEVDSYLLPPPPQGWFYADLIMRSWHRGGAYWLVTKRA